METSIDKVAEQIPNRYLLAVVVAKRAAQIREELNKLGPLAGTGPHPISLALQDIARSHISTVAVEAGEEDLEAKAAAQALSELEEAKLALDEVELVNGLEPSATGQSEPAPSAPMEAATE